MLECTGIGCLVDERRLVGEKLVYLNVLRSPSTAHLQSLTFRRDLTVRTALHRFSATQIQTPLSSNFSVSCVPNARISRSGPLWTGLKVQSLLEHTFSLFT